MDILYVMYEPFLFFYMVFHLQICKVNKSAYFFCDLSLLCDDEVVVLIMVDFLSELKASANQFHFGKC